jgi:hypothetical protein
MDAAPGANGPGATGAEGGPETDAPLRRRRSSGMLTMEGRPANAAGPGPTTSADAGPPVGPDGPGTAATGPDV